MQWSANQHINPKWGHGGPRGEASTELHNHVVKYDFVGAWCDLRMSTEGPRGEAGNYCLSWGHGRSCWLLRAAVGASCGAASVRMWLLGRSTPLRSRGITKWVTLQQPRLRGAARRGLSNYRGSTTAAATAGSFAGSTGLLVSFLSCSRGHWVEWGCFGLFGQRACERLRHPLCLCACGCPSGLGGAV